MEHRSGSKIVTEPLALYDHYDQVYAIDNESLLFIGLDKNKSQDNQTNPFGITNLLEGSTSISAKEGVFNITDLFFSSMPGTQQFLELTTNGIPLKKFNNSNEILSLSVSKLEINLRNCTSGESFTDRGK